MSDHLGPLVIQRKDGAEPFKDGSRLLGFNLVDYWRWSASDLISNTSRGIFAEYLVAKALGIDVGGVRDGWAPYDLALPCDGRDPIRIEVKSSAYLQSWSQTKPSNISFRVPKTRAWDPNTNQLAADSMRQAEVYVFAVLAHMDKSALDPLDVSQWEFYVVATSVLDERTRSQRSIALKTLTRLARGATSYQELPNAVRETGAGRLAA